jgi:hypothetical protein
MIPRFDVLPLSIVSTVKCRSLGATSAVCVLVNKDSVDDVLVEDCVASVVEYFKDSRGVILHSGILAVSSLQLLDFNNDQLRRILRQAESPQDGQLKALNIQDLDGQWKGGRAEEGEQSAAFLFASMSKKPVLTITSISFGLIF